MWTITHTCEVSERPPDSSCEMLLYHRQACCFMQQYHGMLGGIVLSTLHSLDTLNTSIHSSTAMYTLPASMFIILCELGTVSCPVAACCVLACYICNLCEPTHQSISSAPANETYDCVRDRTSDTWPHKQRYCRLLTNLFIIVDIAYCVSCVYSIAIRPTTPAA